ncbi:MAG: hypothetical protein AAF990_14775 [Bacteroidota bacterium]
MKNHLLKAVLLFSMSMTVFFTSCEVEDSSDVNQDKIYADYELFYNSNTDKTWVVARFRFGGPTGTNLELTNPAFVSFNGDQLPFNALFTGHFKEYAGRITSGTFSYTNVDGQEFKNSIPPSESLEFPAALDTLTKSQAFTLNWEGTPLAEDQIVGLFAGSWAWGQDALFVQSNLGATNLVLGTNQLDNLPNGNTTLYMDRATEKDLTEGTGEGGKIRAKYRAKNKVVWVRD